jgi:hypothetical protein
MLDGRCPIMRKSQVLVNLDLADITNPIVLLKKYQGLNQVTLSVYRSALGGVVPPLIPASHDKNIINKNLVLVKISSTLRLAK